MNKEEEIYLSELGLTFPTNEKELIAFDNQNENFDFDEFCTLESEPWK